MGVTVVTSDATIQVNTSQRILAPSGWDAQVAEYGRGYNYPQPGQTTVFRTGDDADIEATIFAPVRVANSLKVQNSLINFLTLGNTNSFGNTNRLTDINGLQVYGDGLIIDNYTGLMWDRAVFSKNYNTAIDDGLSKTTGGFSDWFFPSKNQYLSIWRTGDTFDIGFNYSPFNIPASTFLGCSTTDPDPTANYLLIRGSISPISTSTKTTTRSGIFCRKHF